ncbi:hypothetical protein SpCBS45565_g06324 [Spizellomyces sp. 'palustris']|nr:hypothetical protein SpCBS45565_g06324 [Spizellomyces sp. 'palustris']
MHFKKHFLLLLVLGVATVVYAVPLQRRTGQGGLKRRNFQDDVSTTKNALLQFTTGMNKLLEGFLAAAGPTNGAQTPPGQTPPGQAPPGQTPPGPDPLGQTPPGQNPPGQNPPPGPDPPGQTPPGQNPPPGPAPPAPPPPAPVTIAGQKTDAGQKMTIQTVPRPDPTDGPNVIVIKIVTPDNPPAPVATPPPQAGGPDGAPQPGGPAPTAAPAPAPAAPAAAPPPGSAASSPTAAPDPVAGTGDTAAPAETAAPTASNGGDTAPGETAAPTAAKGGDTAIGETAAPNAKKGAKGKKGGDTAAKGGKGGDAAAAPATPKAPAAAATPAAAPKAAAKAPHHAALAQVYERHEGEDETPGAPGAPAGPTGATPGGTAGTPVGTPGGNPGGTAPETPTGRQTPGGTPGGTTPGGTPGGPAPGGNKTGGTPGAPIPTAPGPNKTDGTPVGTTPTTPTPPPAKKAGGTPKGKKKGDAKAANKAAGKAAEKKTGATPGGAPATPGGATPGGAKTTGNGTTPLPPPGAASLGAVKVIDQTATVQGITLRFKIAAPEEFLVGGAKGAPGTDTLMGLNVLLHGDGGSPFEVFPNRNLANGLMGVAVLAPKNPQSRNLPVWGGGKGGNDRPDGPLHSAAINDLIQNELPKLVNFDKNKVSFTGVSGGSLLLSGYFIPTFATTYKNNNFLLNCGALAPAVKVKDPASLGTLRVHFQSTQNEQAGLKPEFNKAMAAYSKELSGAGLNDDAINKQFTADASPKGAHCAMDGKAFVSGVTLMVDNFGSVFGDGNVQGIGQVNKGIVGRKLF